MSLGTLIETRALVLRRIDEGRALNGASPGAIAPTGSAFTGSDAALIEAARGDANGEKFARLFGNSDTGYKSASEADAALIGILGFRCGNDPDRIERLMRLSERARDKWDEPRPTDDGDVNWLRYSILEWLKKPGLKFYGQPATTEARAIRFLAGPDRAMLTDAEIAGSPVEPAAIVAGYLPEDCGSKSAQGGTGKTTLALYEAIHIILDRELWGRKIEKPGNVAFITAEDSRAMTAYRMNCICTAMGLSPAERERVRRGFFCEDLSDKIGARLVALINGEIKSTALPDEIIQEYRNRDVRYLHLDPTSLLGPGEQAGNDGMTELMRVGRMISRELKASVRNIHHVSQHVARAGIQDQFVGRGGTAFADNGRFSHQLVAVPKRKHTFDGADYLMPAEATDDALRRGHVLAILIHKVSYMARPADPIFILRDGFHYQQLDVSPLGQAPPGPDDARLIPKVVDYLNMKLADGLRYAPSKFYDDHCGPLGMRRAELRRIVDEGLQTGVFEEVPLPRAECVGRKKTFIRPKAGLYE
jgi:hypothetical protein